MAKNTDYFEKKSLEYRKTVLEIIYNSGAGHTGGSLSCVDILNVLYNNFSLADWGYRTETFSEVGLENVKIFVNDNFFREYDLTKPETKEHIIACNSWNDLPE